MVDVLLRAACRWDDVLTDDGTDNGRKCGWGKIFVNKPDQTLLLSFVAPSLLLSFIVVIVLAEAHGTEITCFLQSRLYFRL